MQQKNKILKNKFFSLIPLTIAMSLAVQSGFATPNVKSLNPFADARFYVNPDYAQEVQAFFARNPGYQEKADKLGLLQNGQWNISTAIWLDSKDAIQGKTVHGGHSMSDYLNDALQQATAQKPIVITFVIYDLPLRDCNAYSSNGEFKTPEDIINYKSDYINPIQKILADFYTRPNSEHVRTVLVVEPDSLPNLITNADHDTCKIAKDKNTYTDGIRYALTQFTNIPNGNIYLYLDIAHSGWLGWAGNMNKVASIYNSTVLGEGFNKIRGFITNTANYTPLKEAFTYAQYLPNDAKPSDSNWIMLTDYYQSNNVYDEASYIAEIGSLDTNGKLVLNGRQILPPTTPAFYKDMHFLVDTSRNGWMVNSTDYVALDGAKNPVHYSRRDQRHHRGNWCNIQNVQPTMTNYDNLDKLLIPAKPTSAGLGELPSGETNVQNPLYGQGLLPIDAYVWIKPPGESDGFYIPSDTKSDQMCGSKDGGSHDDWQSTDSLQNGSDPAPQAGYFFDQALKNLMDVRGCIDQKFSSPFCPGGTE